MKATLLRARVVALAIAAVLSAVSCRSGGRPAPAAAPVVEVLVDLTGSSDSGDRDREVLTALDKVVAHVSEQKGHLVVATIGDSLRQATTIFEGELGGPCPNPTICRARAAAVRRAIVAGTAQALAAPATAAASDLFAAVRAAADDLVGFPSRPAMLVLLSDMVHTVPPADLRVAPLDAAGVERVIAGQREADLLPDLRGARVYAAGLGADGVTTARAGRLAAFWRAYFEAANASSTAVARRLAVFP